jgi:hypothetical protein
VLDARRARLRRQQGRRGEPDRDDKRDFHVARVL